MKIVRDYSFTSHDGKRVKSKIIKGFVALYISSDYWILAKGYTLYKYDPKTENIEYFSRLKDSKSAFFSKFKLTRRLLRAEITHLYKFDDDWYCIARKTIFKYNRLSKVFEACHSISRGSRPMNLCCDTDGVIYYGEYFFNPDRVPVNIICSRDKGVTWEIAFNFGKNEINHIHGIFNDKYTGRLWFFTGDDDKACIAGYTTDGFKTLHRELEGRQEYRVCVPIFQKDAIIYPTDSQYTPNSIRRIDRVTKKITDLKGIQGSGIYAADTGIVKLISTTVEPSKVNTDNLSHLWYSFDGEEWKELVSFEKDCWKTTLFQFGSIRFPYYADVSENIVFTGRSIKKLDQSTLIIPVNSI